jgi:LysR family glycine cleavage system transcriptional activator
MLNAFSGRRLTQLDRPDWPQEPAGADQRRGIRQRAAGIKHPEPKDGPLYEDALLMLEAAVAGHGVALMAETLAAPYLAEGRLSRPFAADCPDRSFYVVAPPAVQEKRGAMDFIRWLVRSAKTA